MEFMKRLASKLKFWYFVYSLHSVVSLMEPVEAFIFNTILVAIIAMVLYTSYLFLPGHALMIIHFLKMLLGGEGEEAAATVPHVETS